MVARRMNPVASISLAKFGLPLGALGSLVAQESIRAYSRTELEASSGQEYQPNQTVLGRAVKHFLPFLSAFVSSW